jgi:hypothetical protein
MVAASSAPAFEEDGEYEQMWRRTMVHVSMAAALVLIALSVESLAQSVAIELNPAQQAQIKDFVAKQKVPAAQVKQAIAFGSSLPADVELRPVPWGWAPTVSRFRFFHTGNRIYFVDPSTRKVVRIVE